MPQVSAVKKDKISEHIISYLFSIAPESAHTSDIAREEARDEEFIKTILHELESKKLIVKIAKNARGVEYIRRSRWRLSNRAFEAYQKAQR
ncbi:MAG: hypothetical protein AABW79_02135 [Nanoarchaeota archaeon]